MMLGELNGNCWHMDTSVFVILVVLSSAAATWLILFVGLRRKRREEAMGLPAIVRRYYASVADDGVRPLWCSLVVINGLEYICTIGMKLGGDSLLIYERNSFLSGVMHWNNVTGVAKIPLSHLYISHESTRWWMFRKIVINDMAGGKFVLITDIIRSDFDDLCDKMNRLRLAQSSGQAK